MTKSKIDLTSYLYERARNVMDIYDYEDVYSIVFLVYSNECFEYKNYSNVTKFSISCNKDEYFRNVYANHEDEYEGTDISMEARIDGRYSEMRWNYAHMKQDDTAILDDESYRVLFAWYKQEGIVDIGLEEGEDYDENMKYIGKGPNGYFELLQVIKDVAKQIQSEDYFLNKIGRRIPIIITDLDCAYYTIDVTKEANIHGEADDYIKYTELF